MPKSEEDEQKVKHAAPGLKDHKGKSDKKDDWFGPSGKPTKLPKETSDDRFVLRTGSNHLGGGGDEHGNHPLVTRNRHPASKPN